MPGYETPCHRWTGYVQPNGYGKFSVGEETVYAHRFAYETAMAAIAGGLTLDHLCRNRACVNVNHLEVVTNQVNVLRGQTVTAANAAKTHCPKGHEYTPENTYITPTRHGRVCRTCRRDHRRARTVQAREQRTQEPTPTATHCRNGHLYDSNSTYVRPNGVRDCRVCARNAHSKYRHKRQS